MKKRERTTRLVDGRWRRKCTVCRVEKDLLTSFSRSTPTAKRVPARYCHECKACAVRRQTERRERLMAEPETARLERARRAELQRRWREQNPERYAEQKRRKRERLRSDPEQRRRAQENRRIDYRLQREREGVPLEAGWRKANSTKFPDRGGRLPAAPLGEAIVAAAERAGLSLAQFCDECGVHERSVYAWTHGERKSVHLYVALAIVTRAGLLWHDVWPPDQYPKVEQKISPT